MKNETVEISVNWADELHSCKLKSTTWRDIVNGVKSIVPAIYWYEGEEYYCEWVFNKSGLGSLIVNYDGGGVHFDGDLADANIAVDGESLTWEEELDFKKKVILK